MCGTRLDVRRGGKKDSAREKGLHDATTRFGQAQPHVGENRDESANHRAGLSGLWYFRCWSVLLHLEWSCGHWTLDCELPME